MYSWRCLEKETNNCNSDHSHSLIIKRPNLDLIKNRYQQLNPPPSGVKSEYKIRDGYAALQNINQKIKKRKIKNNTRKQRNKKVIMIITLS